MRMLGLFGLLSVLALNRPCQADDQASAKAMFKQGIELFKKENYEEALAAFEESYRLKPKPQVLYNIAMCHQALFQYSEAIEAFNRLIEEGGSNMRRKKLDTARESLEKLLSLVGTVSLDQAPDGAELFIDGNAVGTTPLTKPLYLNPGDYRVQLKLEGYHTLDTRITVVAEALIKVHGALVPVRAEPVEQPGEERDQQHTGEPESTESRFQASSSESESGVSVMFVTSLCLLGVGAGGLVVGGVFTAKHNGYVGDLVALEEELDAKLIPYDEYNTRFDDTSDEITKTRVGMAVGYGAGGVLMATGAVLLIIDLLSDDDEKSSSVAVMPSYNGLTVTF